MKKTMIMMVTVMMMFAAMFTGCGKKVDDKDKEVEVMKTYVEETFKDTDDIGICYKDGDRWYVKYAYRIPGLKDDRWYFGDRTLEVVDEDVVLIVANCHI